MIYLYSDVINRSGGIETYLHALATKLHEEAVPFRVRVAVSEQEHCPLLDELENKGIGVYRQSFVPGDRWLVRQRLLMYWLWWQLKPGDWVYCVRQPLPPLYRQLVRLVHSRRAKIAASWMLAPEFLVPEEPHFKPFCEAVRKTDIVISVSACTKSQFKTVYGYDGRVEVVRYHNLPFFQRTVPLPEGPPWKIGYMGRLHIGQKNLDTLLQAFQRLRREEPNTRLNLYGEGADRKQLETLAQTLGLSEVVTFHGHYDHRSDLEDIIAQNHLFTYTSKYEGGPCFSLLELMQAGRYVVAAPVGGIPDLYAQHPEAGLLVDANTPDAVSRGLQSAIERVREGRIQPSRIRSRYLEEFDMRSAHEGWLRALSKHKASPVTA